MIRPARPSGVEDPASTSTYRRQHVLDLVTRDDGVGIRGGVCGGPGHERRAIFYIGVPDVADPEGVVTGLAGG